MDDDDDTSSTSSSSNDERLPLAIDVPRLANADEDEFDMADADGAIEAEASGGESDPEIQREPFDPDLPSMHQYLPLHRYDDGLSDFKPLEPNAVITVSIIELPVVMYPNQFLPFHAQEDRVTRQLLEASRRDALMALKPDFEENVNKIATLIQVVQISATNESSITVHALGRQRCRVLDERSAINGMKYGDVKVLEDNELLPFIPLDVPRGLARLNVTKRLSVFSALTAHHRVVIEQAATKKFVDRIVRWLGTWFPPHKIQANLAQGIRSFSFWVAANIPVDTGIRLELLEESCADRRLINECLQLQSVDEVVCRRCSTFLCSVSDILSVSTEGNGALFVNPGGYVHDMFTVSKLKSTRPVGDPSAEYSWFPGYEWTIHNCARCQSFVGWKFTSKSLTPRFFYGVNRTMVCPRSKKQPVKEGTRVSANEYYLIRL